MAGAGLLASPVCPPAPQASRLSSPPAHPHGTLTQREHERRTNALGSIWALLPFVLSFVSGMGLFVILPLCIEAVHRAKVPLAQTRSDGEMLNGLASFRDILWEMWGPANARLRSDRDGYTFWTTVMYLANFGLWWAWAAVRHFRHRAWHLMVKLHILLATSLLCNLLSWFPLPSGFLQHEPLAVTYAAAFVVRSAHLFVAPRIAWSLILLYDATKEPRLHPCCRALGPLLYIVSGSFYVWATRQVYSFSLVVDVMAAWSSWYLGEDLVSRIYPRVASATQGKDSASQLPEEPDPVFTLEISPAVEDEDALFNSDEEDYGRQATQTTDSSSPSGTPETDPADTEADHEDEDEDDEEEEEEIVFDSAQ